VTLSVHDLNGNRIAEHADTGAVIREYIWLDGRPLAVVEGGQVFWLHWDHILRPVLATDAAGAVVWAARYLPFGGIDQVWVDTLVLAQNLRFPGQWFQAETGLHQNGMRDYDPTTGRYLEADPLGLVDGPSVYGYARQSPVRYTDPTGQYVDIIVDAGFIIYDLIRLGIDGECNRAENLAALAADIAGAVIPFATGLGLAARAGSRAGNVAKGAPKSLKDQAADLIPQNANKNRVTLRSPSQKMEVDLAGRTHGDVPTPHTKVSPRNLDAPNQPAYNTKNSPVRPATQQDIRTVRRYLERQGRQ
jgi:RHS repeat-associated protein